MKVLKSIGNGIALVTPMIIMILSFGLFALFIVSGFLYYLYWDFVGEPRMMEESFYRHFQWQEGCNDHQVMECRVNDMFQLSLGKDIRHYKGSYLDYYCIPECEVAFRDYTAGVAWFTACSETPYGYHLFNRTRYEELLPVPMSLGMNNLYNPETGEMVYNAETGEVLDNEQVKEEL